LKAAIDAYNLEINAKVHSSTGKIPSLVLAQVAAGFSPLPKDPYVASYWVMRRVEANMAIVRLSSLWLLRLTLYFVDLASMCARSTTR
jgi:hypothetical protein